MTIRAAALIGSAALLLAGCDSGALLSGDDAAESDIERAAIDAGIVPDPATLDLEGLYEAGREPQNDRFCAVKSGDDYNVGLYIYYGSDQYCEGQGTATLDNEIVSLRLKGESDDDALCEVEAVFDGTQIVLPGSISKDCRALCRQRASMAGVSIALIESGAEAALRAKGHDKKALCEADG